MKHSELLQIIREEVDAGIALLKEGAGQGSAPKTFEEFRKIVAAGLKKCGAPQDLVEEVEDVGYEGGGVFDAIWYTWNNVDAEMRGARGAERDDIYNEVMPGSIADLVLDVTDAYANDWNYEPGRKPVMINVQKLTQDLENVMFPVRERSPQEIEDYNLEDTISVVEEILTNAGAKNIRVSGTLVHYDSTKEIENRIHDEALKSHLRFNVVAGETFWEDEGTKLHVVFKNGVARILKS